jgi:uracil-DNA glycosylase family 4
VEQLVIKKAVDCDRCNLCNGAKQTVFAHGTRSRGILLVGEAPGKKEDARGLPYVGQDGKILKKWMRYVGLSRKKDYTVTYLVKHRTTRSLPTWDEIDACERWLKKELQLLRPWLVITLGKLPAQVILDKKTVNFTLSKEAGYKFPMILSHLGYHTRQDIIVFPLLSPNHSSQYLDEYDSLYKHLDRLKDLLKYAPDAKEKT